MDNHKTAAIVHKEVNGFEVGVLEDGTTYATSRGLARLCGVHRRTIQKIMTAWKSGLHRPREVKLQELLREAGYQHDALDASVMVASGPIQAHPEQVVMAILSYYAFEAKGDNRIAQKNFRTLGLAGFRKFVYLSVGYDPRDAIASHWRDFHERYVLNQTPPGYFSVFGEMAAVIVDAIRGGLPCDKHTIPDISVGQAWARYWKKNHVAKRHGERALFPHIYPPGYARSSSEQMANVYPIAALPEFRWWLHEQYLPCEFPSYLQRKLAKSGVGATRAHSMTAAVRPPMLMAS